MWRRYRAAAAAQGLGFFDVSVVRESKLQHPMGPGKTSRAEMCLCRFSRCPQKYPQLDKSSKVQSLDSLSLRWYHSPVCYTAARTLLVMVTRYEKTTHTHTPPAKEMDFLLYLKHSKSIS
jgi:hypothetical protein